MYAWTKRAFGEKHGFVAGWCYWVNNVLYPANLLISTAAMFTYAIGRGGTGLEADWWYVLGTTLVMLWVAVGINIVGLQAGKWLQNVGAVATYVPALVLIVLGLRAMTVVPAFGLIHPKWKTPYGAILIQAGLATLFLLLSVLGKGTTVERAYLILLDTMLLIYFIHSSTCSSPTSGSPVRRGRPGDGACGRPG
jgi:amino acid transporter